MNIDELIKSYKKDYFEKTGCEIEIKPRYPFSEIRRFISNYICKYNIIFADGKKGNRTVDETNKIHLLRWILKNKYEMSGVDIAHYTNCDRTYAYRSIKLADSFIKNNDSKFMSVYNLVFVEKPLSL